MPIHDFAPLLAAYPAVIGVMPSEFTSHQFIRELMRQEQVLLIEALYAYRHQLRAGRPAPFMIVHGILTQRLADFPHLVTKISTAAPSVDLFGSANQATQWRKVR